jgi:hypothetical protein
MGKETTHSQHTTVFSADTPQSNAPLWIKALTHAALRQTQQHDIYGSSHAALRQTQRHCIYGLSHATLRQTQQCNGQKSCKHNNIAYSQSHAALRQTQRHCIWPKVTQTQQHCIWLKSRSSAANTTT